MGQIIKFETAKLAQEKGLKIEFDCDNLQLYASTQEDLSNLLRCEHKIHISIQLNKKSYKYQIQYIPLKNEYGKFSNLSKNFNTYEECLENALVEALNFIK